MVMDALIGFAKSQAPKLSKFTGKSTEEISRALEQGKKLLPDLMRDSKGTLNRLGVSQQFIDEMYQKYAVYSDKIGVGRGTLDREYNKIRQGLDAGKKVEKTEKSSFNKDKYPKF